MFNKSYQQQVLCRKDETNESIEWQANHFAMCLTMPKHKIYEIWKRFFGSYKPMSKANFIQGFKAETRLKLTDNEMFDIAMKDFAREQLGVSPKALRIRLEDMNLLQNLTAEQLI